MIARLLIANRGEIAVRIIRACRERGIESVAVYSDGDTEAIHTRLADRAVAIGPAPATASYLSVDRIIDAARQEKADAVHPGYGFLAESAALAHACRDAGLTFVGPSPEAMEQMGSKIEARRAMSDAGVPIVPGDTPADQSDQGVRDAARRIGFPLLIKASAGGGGKGMRHVESDASLDEAIASARREASAAFGDGTLYVERRLVNPRHIEIQIFGDAHGQHVHLFERECSTQRRHQKIVEESPSPAVSSDLRARMGAAAVAAARAVDYQNAGTVEFLVESHPDDDGTDAAFYFLEMNTRLQVEHPVTECVTGVDIVGAQLAVAAGAPLPWSQSDLTQRGHAIECRIYAEDPVDFLPQAGRILLYREPVGPGIRVDAGVAEGSEVSVHYDPLLAKLIAYGETRESARQRALAALREYAILGIDCNVGFLIRVLEHPRFQSGAIDTGFVDAERSALSALPPTEEIEIAMAASAAAFLTTGTPDTSRRDRQQSTFDPWVTQRSWRG